jgi:integration host factor subunit alpha
MAETLTRAALSRALVQKLNLSAAQAEDLVQQTLTTIGNCLGNGESVKLTGFGTFEVRQRGARKGRNPKTGESYPVAERRVVVYTPSGKLRTQLDERSSS